MTDGRNLSVPKTAVFELTYRCNHRCLFCSVPWDNPDGSYARGRELTLGEWQAGADALLEKGVTGIALSGGEPLLNHDLPALIEYLSTRKARHSVFDAAGRQVGQEEKPIQLTLITNGQLVDDRWAERLRGKIQSVVVSLPGLSAMPELTGGGSPEKALAAMRRLDQAGIPVVAGICVTRHNLPELFETIAQAFLAGARQLLLNRFLQGGRGTGHPELCLNRAEIREMLDTAETVCREANTLGSVGTELPQCLVENTYRMLKIGTMCAGGVDFFAVDPSGRVRPCNHSPVALGSLNELSNAIGTDYWQTFKTKRFLPRMCHGCSKTLECDGGCREAAHIVGGRLDAPDPVFPAESGRP